jgi:segregation and condensation protein A
VSTAPDLQLDAFAGPLDLLLDLARAQRVDLRHISIATLADQFVAAVESSSGAALAQRTDWLVMASWLVLLKSRLLLPTPTGEAAQREAEQLRNDLALRDHLSTAIAWLEAQPRLGREVFARPAPPSEIAARGGDVVSLIEACLLVLRITGPETEPQMLLPPPPPWTVADARARLLALLPDMPSGSPLEAFMPPPDPRRPARAVLATTLLAGLELAREGLLHLDQGDGFGAITVRPVRRRRT